MMDMASYDTGAAEEASYSLQVAIRGFPGLATLSWCLHFCCFLKSQLAHCNSAAPCWRLLWRQSPWAIAFTEKHSLIDLALHLHF